MSCPINPEPPGWMMKLHSRAHTKKYEYSMALCYQIGPLLFALIKVPTLYFTHKDSKKERKNLNMIVFGNFLTVIT